MLTAPPPSGPLVLADLRRDLGAHDLRARAVRHAVLGALLGDLERADHGLAQALLAAEAAAHATGDSLAGDEVLLRRAGFVLALFRDPDDVWRHREAKLASADTFGGYPLAALAAAGLELTVAWMHATPDPRGPHVLGMLDALDAEAVAAWWMAMREEHGGPEAPT